MNEPCEHCWTLKLGARKEESGGDEDCSWVRVTYDLHEECLKCLAERPLKAQELAP